MSQRFWWDPSIEFPASTRDVHTTHYRTWTGPYSMPAYSARPLHVLRGISDSILPASYTDTQGMRCRRPLPFTLDSAVPQSPVVPPEKHQLEKIPSMGICSV